MNESGDGRKNKNYDKKYVDHAIQIDGVIHDGLIMHRSKKK
jgi:hypothetical protein